jgi:hypothetical protein
VPPARRGVQGAAAEPEWNWPASAPLPQPAQRRAADLRVALRMAVRASADAAAQERPREPGVAAVGALP